MDTTNVVILGDFQRYVKCLQICFLKEGVLDWSVDNWVKSHYLPLKYLPSTNI